MEEKNKINVKYNAGEMISPYDETYPTALLSNSIGKAFNKVDNAVGNIYKAVSKSLPDIAELSKLLKKDFRYVLDISDDVKKKIANGQLKLTVENGGKIYAQFKNGGRYGKKIPVKKEVFSQDLDPAQMANAMQMRAIQNQLEDISNQLLLIDSSAREILKGQQNDRIALYYSGLSLYLESKNVSDEQIKQQLLLQALKTLADARFQLDLTFKADVEYLKNKEFNKHRKEKIQLIDEKMENISQSFKYIHQSSILRAAIYCEQGELSAMTYVLNDYSKFINNNISKNASMLSEYDKTDSGIENTGWKARANLELDVSSIYNQINKSEKILYLRAE